jgi:hypothetical protein
MSRDTIKSQFSKEPIYVVEIDVPRCILVHGSSPCTATETGDDKCYNTRSTCNDLENYNDDISSGSISIAVTASSRRFTRSSGNFITDGFIIGSIITTTGFFNAGNNSSFKVTAVTATIITVQFGYGLVDESSGSGRTIKARNIYTYKQCSNRAPHPQNMNNYAPCVESVSTSPAVINAKGGIGARASATVSFSDFPSSDRYDIDPYLSDRTYDPFDVGLYWTKWRARNANYENYVTRVLSGYIVNNKFTANNFQTRNYVLASMTATGAKAGIRLKDPMQLISNKKALAPKPSSGLLVAAITNTATSATLKPAGVGNLEYDASGFVKIRDEVIAFTRSGDVLTLTRAEFNTAASAHDEGDTVQLCLNYPGDKPANEVQRDLIVTYGGLPAYFINGSAWEAEVDTYLSSNPNRLITDPTLVDVLIAELCEQWPHKLFWNEILDIIELSALKPPPTGGLNELTGNNNIMELSTGDKSDMQLSTVFVNYGQFDPTKKTDEKDNYQITYARVNNDAIARYDSNNTKVVFAPWISANNGAAARKLAQLHGRRFGITPRQINFTLDDKDSSYWIGDFVNINFFGICDRNGNSLSTAFEILSASEGSDYKYSALEYSYDGELSNDDDLQTETVDLAVDETNVNLRTKYNSVFGTPDSSTEVKFIVYSGVVIGSTSNSTFSLDTGSWPAGATITLQNNSGGIIAGKGGDGADAESSPSNGGDAINLSYDLTLINNGIIGGGGGGGAANQSGSVTAGGGGGAGYLGGVGGIGIGARVLEQSQNGTNLMGGAGEEREDPEDFAEARGQSGGDLGQNGGASEGAAGKAVELNSNTLTETVSGDIRGAIS